MGGGHDRRQSGDAHPSPRWKAGTIVDNPATLTRARWVAVTIVEYFGETHGLHPSQKSSHRPT